MKMTTKIEEFPLKKPFVINHGTVTTARLVVVELTDNGYTGRGECCPAYYYDQSPESTLAVLEKIRPDIEGGLSQADLQNHLHAGSARNALDCAFWDLRCKQSNQSIWQISDTPEPETSLAGDITIGLGTPAEMQQDAEGFAHFDLIKVKLNNQQVLDRMQAVRAGAPNSRFMVDVNEGWTLAELKEYVPRLKELGVELIEQPLPRGKDWGLIEYDCPVKLAGDESCFDRHDLPFLKGRYDYINIKLDKTGGLTEALALIKEARKMGFGLMTGCMVASSLSMAPAFVIASLCQYRDLDGPTMLVQDRTPSMLITDGEIPPFDRALWG